MSEPSLISDLDFPADKRRLADVLTIIANVFVDAGIEQASLDARLLLQHGLGIDHAAVILQSDRVIEQQEIECLTPLIARRLQREPVSRIVGQREFWSLPFVLSPETLDPRPDTEVLVEVALDLAQRLPQDKLNILDLGTGSGCILLSLLSELPEACGVGVDRSMDALAVARLNATRLNLADRTTFIESDWFDQIEGQFDLVVANPPYIPNGDIEGLTPEVALYDPHRALAGGETGLEAYANILAKVDGFLAPQSALVFECGLGQDQALLALIEASSVARRVTRTLVKADLQGINRVVAVKI